MKTYFNMKSYHGTETIDELDSSDFPSLKEYFAECDSLLAEYRMCMNGVYRSKRCTNDWRDR